MAARLYFIWSGIIFLLVALFHLFRLLYAWPIVVGSRTIPHVLSYVGLPASTGYFLWAYWLLRRSGRKRNVLNGSEARMTR